MSKRLRYDLIVLFTSCLMILSTVGGMAVEPVVHPAASPADISSANASPTILLEQGQQYYQAGQFNQAVTQWQQAVTSATNATDLTLAYTYLILAYQDLGQWSAADRALAQALAQVPDQPIALAQVLNAQGRLQFYQGRSADALATWQAAEQNYRQGDDLAGVILAQTNQIQALRSLGYYTQARRLITTLRQALGNQPDSLLKAQGLQSVGMILRITGDLEASQAVLIDSLALVQKLGDRDAIAQTQFQLGNTAQVRGDIPTALGFYQQVLATAPHHSHIRLETSLNQLRLLIQQQQWASVTALTDTLSAQLETLPPSRWGVYAQVNFAETLLTRSNLPSPLRSHRFLAALLAQAVQQAQLLNDIQAESYALGQLGKLYEQSHQWSEALLLTDRAIHRSQQVQANEITAVWQWQRGRILKAQGQTEAAVGAYSQSVALLESLDQDLVALNPDVQFSFQKQVEPVYRQLVQLLLENIDNLPMAQQQQRLARAREVIEALQLAELENFFREACLTYSERAIDEIDPQAAVVYPILLDQRLEVVLALPDGTLQHHGTSLSPRVRQETFQALRQALSPAFPAERVLGPAQQLYDWLLRPAEEILSQQGVERLVFVPDGYLRNLPMAVLHDGEQFLIERYSIALTLGLQLFESMGFEDRRLEVLAGGVSVEHQGFDALPAVDVEINQIQTKAITQVLLNNNFTKTNLAEGLVERPISIIHLATHGQFSSKLDDTFILTWNNRLSIKELEGVLQQRELQMPIEMLILSACQTAKGDDRAALGMAGVAVRSGARSTLASLWSVEDFSTADLMTEFYRQLGLSKQSRAESLRRAQLSLLASSDYHHPYYWAPFVLIGNWL